MKKLSQDAVTQSKVENTHIHCKIRVDNNQLSLTVLTFFGSCYSIPWFCLKKKYRRRYVNKVIKSISRLDLKNIFSMLTATSTIEQLKLEKSECTLVGELAINCNSMRGRRLMAPWSLSVKTVTIKTHTLFRKNKIKTSISQPLCNCLFSFILHIISTLLKQHRKFIIKIITAKVTIFMKIS